MSQIRVALFTIYFLVHLFYFLPFIEMELLLKISNPPFLPLLAVLKGFDNERKGLFLALFLDFFVTGAYKAHSSSEIFNGPTLKKLLNEVFKLFTNHTCLNKNVLGSGLLVGATGLREVFVFGDVLSEFTFGPLVASEELFLKVNPEFDSSICVKMRNFQKLGLY